MKPNINFPFYLKKKQEILARVILRIHGLYFYFGCDFFSDTNEHRGTTQWFLNKFYYYTSFYSRAGAVRCGLR